MKVEHRTLFGFALVASVLHSVACGSSTNVDDSVTSGGSGLTANPTAGSTSAGGGAGGGSGGLGSAASGGTGIGGGGEVGSQQGGMGGGAGSAGSAGSSGQGGASAGGGGAGAGGGMPTAPVQPFTGTPVTGYRLEWADEFDGSTLDATKWAYRTDSKHWSTQLPANVVVADGLLTLQLKKQSAAGKAYTGAGVISNPAFRYGYYEARMRTPPGRGWHSSFWMMRHDGAGGTGVTATSIELDAMENDSIDPRGYSVNVHRWNPTPHVTFGTKGVRLPANAPSLTADFHVYGCEFSAKAVKYFLDGALVQTVDATQFAHSDVNIWLTSIASFLGGTQSVDDAQLPAMVRVDYVRFFVDTALP